MTVFTYQCFPTFRKQVSFLYTSPFAQFHKKGTVTAFVIHLSTSPQILIDDDDFSFDEITEFQVLDDRSIVDAALTGLITDNKDFIDSLSK